MLEFRKIHFIGIGGISMSALAVLASQSGAWVSGSDRENSKTLERLGKCGLKVYVGHDNSVVAGCDLVVYSGAVGDDDPELKFARINRIRCMERKAFLALMAKSAIPAWQLPEVTERLLLRLCCAGFLKIWVRLSEDT